MMFKFIGRQKRIKNKLNNIGEYLDTLKGRENIDTRLGLAEQICKAAGKNELESICDDFIDRMGHVIIGSHNVNNIKLHNIVNMELVPDKNGNPIMSIWNKAYNGLMFYDFPLCKGFEVHTCNEFLRSLELDIDICFETYCQYGQLIENCFGLLKEKQKATA